MRSRSVGSASSRTLASCPDVKGDSETHVQRCVGLHVCKSEGCCQSMLCFVVGDRFDVLVRIHVVISF